MTDAVPKIEVQGVGKWFDDVRALDGVSLRVEAGEALVLIGGSGAGKTLLLKIILGLVAPDEGRVLVDGTDTTRLSPGERMRFMRKFGMLFQRSALFDSMCIWENVAFRLLLEHKLPRAEAQAIADKTLALVGLSPQVGTLLPAELSGGMQKRVGFARAVVGEPEVILLDEPTAGLDPIMSNVINELIRERVTAMGATTILVTSDMVGARATSDRVAMLHEGRLIWTGPTGDLDSSQNAYVDQFVNKRPEGPIQMRI